MDSICGGALKEVETVRERYEEEIVPIPTLVIRYLIKGGYCVRCGNVVYPEVPETIGNRHFGVHFLLYVAYLRYVMHLPENKIATLLNDTYDARISVGTVVAYLQQAAELFGDDYRRLKKELRDAQICHYDDTGLRVNGENRWLWTFLTKEAVLYLTRRNRGKKVVIEVLGEDYVRRHKHAGLLSVIRWRTGAQTKVLVSSARGREEACGAEEAATEIVRVLRRISADLRGCEGNGAETHERRGP